MLKALSKRAEKICAECRETVRQLVEADRSRGLDAAFDRVSRSTGLTARRVRALWYGEVAASSIAAHEHEALRNAYAKHLKAELAACEHRAAVLRARLSESDGAATVQAGGHVAA